MSISCIKISTGEDLIGDITHTEHGVIIESPIMIVVVPNQKGQYSVGLAPYMIFSAQKAFTFRNENVLMEFEPADELRNDYNRITGKGIVVTPKPKLELV